MAVIDGIGLAEPSTITKSLAAIPITRNSSVTYQEVMVLGSPNSTTSSALAEVTNAALASTAWGLGVRSRSAPESTLWASSAGFHFDSSGAMNVVVTGGASTNIAVTFASSVNTVIARLTTSSGGSLEGSTARPAGNTLGLHTRQVVPTLVTVTSTAGTDTTVTLISSAATTPRITAYSVVSTVAGPVRAGFYAGSTLLWPVLIWADGGVPKDSQQVSPPGYLFTGQADRPVQFSVSSTGAYTVGLTYWTE